MINFKTVKMKNFFSVGNSPVEIQLNSHKKTLVIGKNGSSKSSCIIDSIVFALYGKPFRKTNKPNIINSINKGGLLIELEFSIGNREYKIIRGIKPNIFEIYQNGSLLNQDAKAKDYQEYLEKYILKTNYKSFINVVILGSARYIPFMSMSSSDRRTIIEELLDIQIFSTMNILLKEKVSKLKEEITTYSYNIDLVNEKIELQRHNILENKKNTKDQITQKQKEIKKSTKQIESLKSNISLIEKHIKVFESKIKDKPSIESKKNKLISIESKIETNLKLLTKDCEFYEKNDNCPTCKQSIESSHKTNQIEKNSNKINDLNEGLKKLNIEVVDIENKISNVNEIQIKIQEHQSEIVRINASIIAIQNYIQKELTQINKFSETFDNLEINNDRLKELLTEVENYEIKKKEADEIKKYYDFSSILLKDGGIKTRIVKQYLPILNKLINVYLSKLNFFVNFNITEKFEEVIKSRYRDEFTYENFSEGEKLRIDLSILFAFRQIAKLKNSVNTNLLIMDEILDGSLDLEGIDQFLDLIDSFDNNTHTIIISHRGDQIGDKFDRTLKFEKKKNFTRMQEIG